mmetsp:Transcript_65748/g.161858  ORF Transcript_65748/g.161858 Transcript_65748/m.161858 type:complete len:262 (-) Transcript_65748:155-940(-)
MSKVKKDKEVKPTDTPAAKEGRERVGDLRARIATEAQTIVHELMPQKVLELTKMIEEDPLWRYPDINETYDIKIEEPSKKRKLEDGGKARGTPGKGAAAENGDAGTGDLVKSDMVSEVNETIMKQQMLLKKEIQQCLQHVTKVKIWIQLNIPKVEDGNNFGVSVQEETVNELTRAEDTSFALLDSMNKYLMTRAKLVSRMFKYPGLRDYTLSVQETDRKERINMSLSLNDLRNNYCIMYDTITKNLEKINNPRSQVNLPFT